MDNLTFGQRLLLVLIPALATVGAAWVAVYFSIRKFYAEKLWERKLNTYSEILAMLVDLHHFSATISANSAAIKLRTINWKDAEELLKKPIK